MCRDNMTYEECLQEPWCCDTGCPPGGGGAIRLVPQSYDREVWVGDHGKFASWVTKDIVAGEVLKINEDGTVDIEVKMPNGSHFIEPSVILTPSDGEFNTYLRNREVAQEYRKEALKSAYEEWSSYGYEPLRSVYFEGEYFPANHDFKNTAMTVENNPDGTLNLLAYFRRQNGVMFLKSVPVQKAHQNVLWLIRRSLWLPIYEKWMAEAQKKIDTYLGKKY